ncbi:hypothetical protein DVL38_23315 [Salmonella enterica]|nr:hypothetical protein [Salmonella enterica]
MSGKREGVKGYKQIHLKKFSKTISHNLRLLALSRDLPQYELHDKIITDFIEDAEMIQQPPVIDQSAENVSSADTQELTAALSARLVIQQPPLVDQCGYNVFIGPEAQERAAALSAKLKIPESEIFYSALFAFADRYKLSQPLDKVG